MTTTVIDLIRKQRELKDRLVPKGIQSALELQRKNQPLKYALQNITFQDSPVWTLKDALDVALHSKTPQLTTNAMMAAATAVKSNNLFTENPALSAIAKSTAALGAIDKSLHSSSALYAAIGAQKNLNLNFAVDFFKASQLSSLSAMSSLLRQPNTSPLSQSFEFARHLSKSFILPDFSEFDFEDDIDEGQKIIIQISPTEIPTLIKEFYANNAQLNIINPRKFEEVIAELLRYHGYEVTLTKQSRDGGFDMTLQKTLDDGRPFKALVECKRRKKKIDVTIVRCFSAVAYREGVRDGIIVTTSTFSKDAIKESEFMPADLSLKDRSDVISWAGSYLGKMPVIDLDLSKKKSKGGLILLS